MAAGGPATLEAPLALEESRGLKPIQSDRIRWLRRLCCCCCTGTREVASAPLAGSDSAAAVHKLTRHQPVVEGSARGAAIGGGSSGFHRLAAFEGQQDHHCAVHAINNLLQGPYVSFATLQAIADEQSQAIGVPVECFYNEAGDFQKSIISLALKQLGLRLADYVQDVVPHRDPLLSEEDERIVKATQYARSGQTLPRVVYDTHARFMSQPARSSGYVGCILASGSHYSTAISIGAGHFVHVDSRVRREAYEKMSARAVLEVPVKLEGVIHVLR